jgi:hypothetical protein
MDTKIHPDNVTNCMRCQADLERGYSSRWVGDECKEVICFKCDKIESLDDHMKTGIITTSFMMDCLMSAFDIMRDAYGRANYDPHDEAQLLELLNRDYPETTKAKLRVQLATTRIQNKIKDFDAKVWFKGLQNQIHDTTCRGVSAKLGKKHSNFCVLTWTCAGRTMITIEDDNASVTAVADETSKESRTGLHGIRATGEQAVALIDRAISLFEDGTLKFKDDKKVSMI